MSPLGDAPVGIDLGTSFSSIAFTDRQGRPRVFSDEGGWTSIPSVVYFFGSQASRPPIVGRDALEQGRLDPDNLVTEIKREMGSAWRRDLGGGAQTPESISALILRQLSRIAEPQIGSVAAVLCVPAYFTQNSRRATTTAAEMAGLQVLGVLQEPIAAALACHPEEELSELRYFVFDLGRGTLDVSVASISGGVWNLDSIAGDRRLGGMDWTDCLVQHVVQVVQSRTGRDLRDDWRALPEITRRCEQAKLQLSQSEEVQLEIVAFEQQYQLRMLRSEFEQLTEHLVRRAEEIALNCLATAGLSVEQLDRLVLVGGATKMPAVSQRIEALVGIPPLRSVNPDQVVAMGAAIHARALFSSLSHSAAGGEAAKSNQGPTPAPMAGPQTGLMTNSPAALPAINTPSEAPAKREQLIFISARSTDFGHARTVYQFLTSHGYKVFLSDESLPALGNTDYREAIDQALNDAMHMIVVTSSGDNVLSPWVKAEWGLFINEKRSGYKPGNLLTIIVGDMQPRDLPPSLRYYEVLPLQPASLERLLRYVAG